MTSGFPRFGDTCGEQKDGHTWPTCGNHVAPGRLCITLNVVGPGILRNRNTAMRNVPGHALSPRL